MNLFWLESEDHGGDWFVVADSEAEAQAYFALKMGYEIEGDKITALSVCQVPTDNQTKSLPIFADDYTILNCGGEIVLKDDADIVASIDTNVLSGIGPETRIVKLEDKIFVEGQVESSTV